MTAIFDIINTCFIHVASWFLQLLNSSGMTQFYVSMIFVFLLGKYILKPLFGSSRGSDQVQKKFGGSKNG